MHIDLETGIGRLDLLQIYHQQLTLDPRLDSLRIPAASCTSYAVGAWFAQQLHWHLLAGLLANDPVIDVSVHPCAADCLHHYRCNHQRFEWTGWIAEPRSQRQIREILEIDLLHDPHYDPIHLGRLVSRLLDEDDNIEQAMADILVDRLEGLLLHLILEGHLRFHLVIPRACLYLGRVFRDAVYY